MFLHVNEKTRDAQHEVNDFLTGRGQLGIWICLGVLGLAFIWVAVTGLLA